LDTYAISPPLHLRPGDATIHDLSLVHSAPENATDDVRWVYAIAVFPADALYTVAGLTKAFVIRDGRAVEVHVPPGAVHDNLIEVPGDQIHAGELVAVSRLNSLVNGTEVSASTRAGTCATIVATSFVILLAAEPSAPVETIVTESIALTDSPIAKSRAVRTRG